MPQTWETQQKAQTKPDFNTKMNIALKEANETLYWLKLLYKTDYLTKNEFDSITFMGNMARFREHLPFISCKTLKEVRK